MSESCCCNKDIRMVYSCSGAADVGELSDKVARYIKKKGEANMFCLAGLGAKLSSFIQTAKAAKQNIIIDGCSIKCGAKIFDNIGEDINKQSYLLTAMGCVKGETEVTPELVEKIAQSIIKGL